MSPRRRTSIVVALACSFGAGVVGCGFDESSAATQNRVCHDAVAGETARDTIHTTLGAPTLTERETEDGRRVVTDAWADGTVALSFDADREVLVRKVC